MSRCIYTKEIRQKVIELHTLEKLGLKAISKWFNGNPCSPQEKGRVENAIGYVKKYFLTGRTFRDFTLIGPAARR